MKPLLFDKVFKLSQEIANASAVNNEEQREKACEKLQNLCEKGQGSDKDHPFQWEVLADFTNDGDIALDIYRIALDKAAKKSLPNYSASIYLAMALRYKEFENADKTLEFAMLASEQATLIDDEELQDEISEFLINLAN